MIDWATLVKHHLTGALLGITTLLFCCNAFGLRFEHPFLELGQPARQLGSVRHIVQDQLGFIWLGGDNGLARYDGASLQLYQSNPNLPDALVGNYVWDMVASRSGTLWIATSAGLCFFDPQLNRFSFLKDSNNQPIFNESTTAIAEYTDGRLLIAQMNVLYLVDPTNPIADPIYMQSPVHTPGGENVIKDISVGNDGIVWLATALEGVAAFNPRSGDFRYFHTSDKAPESDGLRSNNIESIMADTSGRIWIGTYGKGLQIYVPHSDTWLTPELMASEASGVVMDIMEDRAGHVWASIDPAGVLRFDQNLKRIAAYSHSASERNSLYSNKPRALFEDANRDVWLGYTPLGFSFVNRVQEHIKTYLAQHENADTISDSAILSILRDSRGLIWVGTEGGLNAFDPATETFRRYVKDADNPKALSSNAILSLAEEPGQGLWVGTWGGGLHYLDFTTDTFTRFYPPSNSGADLGGAYIWSTLRDKDGVIWLGTETDGLIRYEPQTGEVTKFKNDGSSDPHKIPTNFILQIADDGDFLWLASYGGLLKYDKQTQLFHTFQTTTNEAQGLNSLTVKSLLLDGSDTLWVGTNKGLNKLNRRTGKVENIGASSDSSNMVIASMVKGPEGWLWLATNKGLVMTDPITHKQRSLESAPGVIGAVFNRNASIASSDGDLYFGSIDGLLRFKPESLLQEAQPFPVHITDFRIFNRDLPIGGPEAILQKSILFTDAIKLNYKQNMFTFQFSAMNFRAKSDTEYSYKLHGFDAEWINNGKRDTATYTNLDPGQYVFRIRARSPGHAWIENAKNIVVTIDPPPWRTVWAYAIYTLLIIAIGFAIYAIGTLKRSSDKYRELSETDALTGLYNRHGINQLCRGIFAAAPTRPQACLALIDIDHFKRINDQHGHDIGDEVLIAVSSVIQQSTRGCDYLGRWGGEEFILICPDTDINGMKVLVEKIRANVAAHTFAKTDDPLLVTVSIGFTALTTQDTFGEAIKRADVALYDAKSSGRNLSISN